MPTLTDYRTQSAGLDADAFMQRHPHVCLLQVPLAGLPSSEHMAESYDAEEQPTAAISEAAVAEMLAAVGRSSAPPLAFDDLLVLPIASRPRPTASSAATVTFIRGSMGLKHSSNHGGRVTTLSVGRASGSDIVLPYASVSRNHAHLLIGANGSVTVVDQASRNGTYVDGRRIEPGERVKLQLRSTLRFGNLAFELVTARGLYDAVRGVRAPRPSSAGPGV
jgi:hypothetical protein